MKRILVAISVILLVSVVILGGCAQPAPAPAPKPTPPPTPTPTQSAAEFYKGKTIEFYIPSTAGSGLDTVARVLAPMIEKETGATVVPLNKAGGGYTIPINELYEKPDTTGLKFSMVEMSATTAAQMLDMEYARYDLRKMNWLCNTNSGDPVACVSPDSPYQSVADLLGAKQQLVAAATGPTTPTGMAAKIILGTVMGLPVKVVTGYDAAPATYKAVVQKEADITLGLYAAAAGNIQAGTLKALFVWMPERFSVLPNVPTIYEELEKAKKLTPETKYWLDTIVGLVNLQRGIITSPNVVPERLKYLRDVMAKIHKDAALKANFDKLGYTLYYLTGEETQSRINKILEMESAKKEQLKKILTEK